MKYAIIPRGVGKRPGYRTIQDNESLAPGEEFSVSFDPRGFVLDDDGQSLRSESLAEVVAEAKEAKRAELRAARDKAIAAGVSYAGNVYDSDATAQTNVFQALQGLQAVKGLPAEVRALLPGPVPTSISWKTAANDYVDLTEQDLVFLMAVLSLQKQTLFGIERTLLVQLDQATTLESVQAITWPTE